MSNVRVRFAPSPTGPLHIGGVRTALYNYLFAKKNGGTFILRIEDTDQTRYVKGAEEYIIESLKWFGFAPEEGPGFGGDFGPYRQSERKDIYGKYATQLVEAGHAYYCFDTSEDLDKMRADMAAKGVHSAKYNYLTRGDMKNSLSLSKEETAALLEKGENITIRLNIPQDRTIHIKDEVRGDVAFESNELDDKIILIRGEEWLPSTAHHVLMYEFFGWTAPSFSHLPLILKPTGKGKLSKRDGAKFGFPVFPLEWFDEKDQETYAGFKEDGYLPEAVTNFISLLGWNPGNDEEMFSMEELIELFDPARIVKSGARYDVDKSRWFNQQYIIATPNSKLVDMLTPMAKERGFEVSEDFMYKFVELMKERVEMIPDFFTGGGFFFEMPTEIDEKMARKKYKLENRPHFDAIIEAMEEMGQWTSSSLESTIKSYIADHELSFGQIMPILRLGACGTMKGPDLFETMELLGQDTVINRMNASLDRFTDIKNAQNA